MGKIKYISKIREFFKESPIVNIESLKKIIGNKKKDYVYLLINNLLKKKEIRRLTKGYYTINDDPSLIVFCFKPSYLGLQNALSFHNLWEQETNPVIVTTRNIRTGIREVFERNVVVKKIDKNYVFGFEYYKDGDFYLPYSDIEKTFIDMVYFRQHIDKETLKNIRKVANYKKLILYLKKYHPVFRKKVLMILNNFKKFNKASLRQSFKKP
ncbi:hypothetical protein HYW75_04570 [Candidatus Pacearchaeota archaeon]|nr:hypothetical protein [Candidatus Pacearchaeota archaeon]